MLIREVCVGSYREALQAAAAGAERIELCDNLADGGTTPGPGTLQMTRAALSLPIHVIIRPRGGSFHYSADEVAIQCYDIAYCRELGFEGVVLGALDAEGHLDMAVMTQLLSQAAGMAVTFHMAFDALPREEQFAAIDWLAAAGVSRILTRGGPGSAPDNLEHLRALIAYAADRLIILPGGGINRDNLDAVARATGARELHGSRIVGQVTGSSAAFNTEG